METTSKSLRGSVEGGIAGKQQSPAPTPHSGQAQGVNTCPSIRISSSVHRSSRVHGGRISGPPAEATDEVSPASLSLGLGVALALVTHTHTQSVAAWSTQQASTLHQGLQPHQKPRPPPADVPEHWQGRGPQATCLHTRVLTQPVLVTSQTAHAPTLTKKTFVATKCEQISDCSL